MKVQIFISSRASQWVRKGDNITHTHTHTLSPTHEWARTLDSAVVEALSPRLHDVGGPKDAPCGSPSACLWSWAVTLPLATMQTSQAAPYGHSCSTCPFFSSQAIPSSPYTLII